MIRLFALLFFSLPYLAPSRFSNRNGRRVHLCTVTCELSHKTSGVVCEFCKKLPGRAGPGRDTPWSSWKRCWARSDDDEKPLDSCLQHGTPWVGVVWYYSYLNNHHHHHHHHRHRPTHGYIIKLRLSNECCFFFFFVFPFYSHYYYYYYYEY